MHLEILKEAVTLGREKKTHLALSLVRDRGFRVKLVADAMEVSRSNLTDQIKAAKPKRPE